MTVSPGAARRAARREARPGAGPSEAACSAQRGVSTPAQRSDSLRPSARRLRPAAREEGRLVRMRDAQTYEHTAQGDDPGCQARWQQRPAVGGSRDGAVCGKPVSAPPCGGGEPGPFGSLAGNPGETHEWATVKASDPGIGRVGGGPSARAPGATQHTASAELFPHQIKTRSPGRAVHASRQRGAVLRAATWLILPVVICLSQRLSHACLSISCLYC